MFTPSLVVPLHCAIPYIRLASILVADSKAYTQRTLGLCLETGMGLVTLVPRTCTIRQEIETWGQQQVSLPLLLEKAAKRQGDAPRRWYGRSVTREVEVEDDRG